MLLFGATGKIGQYLVPALTAAGARPTLFVRDVDRARTRFGDAVDYLPGDLHDPTAVKTALAGQDVVFLANGQTDDQVALETAAIDAASAAGVRRIVKISALGAQHEAGSNVFARWHHEIEARLSAAPLAGTVLRPNIFAANLLGSAPQIAAGQLFSTTEDGRTAWVHPRDIAELAAAALMDDAHAGREYEVTGPEALSHDELAERLGAGIGRPVQHIRIDDDSFRAALQSAGLPGWVVDAFVEMNARTVRGGQAGAVSSDLPTVLGRPATSIDTWIEEHAAALKG